MLGYMQNVLDDVRDQKLIEEWQRTSSPSTTTASPSIVIAKDADLSINTQITINSEETSIDQSNNGFSFIVIHWASFSTGLSSVLAVVVLFILISGCCYFRGWRQRCFGTSSPAPTATAAPLHVSRQRFTQAPPPQGTFSVPIPSFLSPSKAPSRPLPSTTLPSPPLAASPVAPPNIAMPLPCSTSRWPHRSPSCTSSIPATPKPSSSTKKAALLASTHSTVDAPRRMISVWDYNLAGLAACHSRPGSISHLVLHF